MDNISISARGMDLTEAIKNYCIEKIEKFDYLHDNSIGIVVELTEEIPHRGVITDFKVEIEVKIPGKNIFVSENGGDLYKIIDKASDTLARQLKKQKEKLKQRGEGEDLGRKIAADLEKQALEDDSDDSGDKTAG